MADWIDKLTELRRQKDAGAIDAAEFEANRAEIFAERDAGRAQGRPRPSASPAQPPPPPAPPAPSDDDDFEQPISENPTGDDTPDDEAGWEEPQDSVEYLPATQSDIPFPPQSDGGTAGSILAGAESTIAATEGPVHPDLDPPVGETPSEVEDWSLPTPWADPDETERPTAFNSNSIDVQTSASLKTDTDQRDFDADLSNGQARSVPRFTPPPLDPDGGRRLGGLSRPVILIGSLAFVLGGVGLGFMLLYAPPGQDATPPSGLSVGVEPSAVSPVTSTSPGSSVGQTVPTVEDVPMVPPPTGEVAPKILSGRVTTSVEYDAAHIPSFTATLLARYTNAGQDDTIVASLWKGRTKVSDCPSGLPALIPAGPYRCELNQIPPGAFEFHVGFAGQRTSIYKFKLATRDASLPTAQQTSRVAAPPPPPADVITQPEWVRRPNSESVSRYYPDRAIQKGVEGSTQISCRVNLSGRLVDCTVLSESPEGYGFGQAAIRLAATLRMRPKLLNGEPVDSGIVVIPLQWRMK